MQYHKVIPAPWLLILATVRLVQSLCLLFLVRIIHATGKQLVISNCNDEEQWHEAGTHTKQGGEDMIRV